MAQMWKNRGSYGIILYRKIQRLDKLLKTLNKKESLTEHEIKLYMDISKTQDYAIQVQLTNVKRVEDFEILEKMEIDQDSKLFLFNRENS